MWEKLLGIGTYLWEKMDVYLIALGKIALIFLLGKLLIRICCALAKKSLQRRASRKQGTLSQKKYNTVITLTQSLVRYLIDFVMLIMVLDVLGLGGTVGSLLATAGIGGIALGLGAQSFLKDLLGGLFILFDDEYAIGDYIKLPTLSLEGTVTAISLRSTSLRLTHGEIATIPHGKVEVVINFTRDRYTLFLDYDIAGDQDPNLAGAVILQEIQNWLEENAIENGEAAYLGVGNMQPFKTTLKFMFKVPPLKQWAAERAVDERAKAALAAAGIRLPAYQAGVWVEK